jgi:purine-cytosine permease-like protein
MVFSLLGVLLALFGVFLYRRRMKFLGGFLILLGGAMFISGIVAIVSFHPS